MKANNARVQSERIRDIAIAARHGLADALAPILAAQVRQATLDVESGAGRNIARHAAVWERQLMEAKHGWAMHFAVDGYRLGEVVTGKSAGLMELLGKDDYGDPAVLTAVEVTTADALISRRIGMDVARYVAETSKLETARSINRLSEIFARDVAENRTVAEIARDFADEGASWVSGTGRANMMARTMSQWAYNHGSMEAYADAGAKSEWLASTDACEPICLPLNGVIADEGGLFNGQMFTGHPNCQCTVIPVIPEA